MVDLAEKIKMKSEHQSPVLSFNRFLYFRYAIALFFFINLYWTFLTFSFHYLWGYIPLLLLFLYGLLMIEQTKKYWYPTNRLPFTKIGFGIQFIVNLSGIILILLGHQSLLFPFMNQAGRTLLLSILLTGCIISFLLEWRIWLIENNKDSYFIYLKNIEKNK